MGETEPLPSRFKVAEALAKDVGRAIARLDPEDLESLGVSVGDVVEVLGKRATVCRVMPAYKEMRGQARVQLDGLSRANAGAGLDDYVVLRRVDCPLAERVVVTPVNVTPKEGDLEYIAGLLDGLPVVEGDRIRVNLFGSRSAEFTVLKTAPKGPVLIGPPTHLFLEGRGGCSRAACGPTSVL